MKGARAVSLVGETMFGHSRDYNDEASPVRQIISLSETACVRVKFEKLKRAASAFYAGFRRYARILSIMSVPAEKRKAAAVGCYFPRKSHSSIFPSRTSRSNYLGINEREGGRAQREG